MTRHHIKLTILGILALINGDRGVAKHRVGHNRSALCNHHHAVGAAPGRDLSAGCSGRFAGAAFASRRNVVVEDSKEPASDSPTILVEDPHVKRLIKLAQ